MPIYIRFENNQQVATTTLPTQPKGWYEAPADFDWQKSYCLTEEGTIAERSKEDLQAEFLHNAKAAALDTVRVYFNHHVSQYTGHSHQKARSYEVQATAAASILAAHKANTVLDEQAIQLLEPLAQVRGISVVAMAQLIQSKAQNAAKEIAQCEALEDSMRNSIQQATTQEELQRLLNKLIINNK